MRNLKSKILFRNSYFLLYVIAIGTTGNCVSSILLGEKSRAIVVFTLNEIFIIMTLVLLDFALKVSKLSLKLSRYLLFGVGVLIGTPHQFATLLNSPSSNQSGIAISKTESEILLSQATKGEFSTYFNHKILIYLLFFLAILCTYNLKRGWFNKNRELPYLFFSLLLISWYNTSFGSPYSWVPTFEQSVNAKLFQNTNLAHLYVVHPFGNLSTYVNADDYVHSSLISLFQNGKYQNLMLIRRPFSYFLVSHIANFMDTYSAWILFNLICLLFLAFILHGWVRSRIHVPLASYLIPLVIIGSPLMTSFIGQNSGYMLAVATPILIYLVADKLSSSEEFERGHLHLFAALYLAANFVYDISFWGIALLYAAVIGKKLKFRWAISIWSFSIVSLGIYRALIIPALGLQIDNTNEVQILKLFKVAIGNISVSNTLSLSNLAFNSISSTTQMILTICIPLSAFLLISCLALMPNKLENSTFDYVLIKVSLLCAFALQVLFNFGGNGWLATFPRFSSFILVPWLIILTSFAKNTKKPSTAIVVLVMLTTITLGNDLRLFPGWASLFLQSVNG